MSVVNDSKRSDSGQSGVLPPFSNTGVTNGWIGGSKGTVGESACLDWLEFSLDGGMLRESVILDGVGLECVGEVRATGHPNYNQAWDLYPAGEVLHNSLDERQGWHFRFRGGDLRVVREAGVDEVGILAGYLALPAECKLKFSRLDIALDFFGPDTTVGDLKRCCDQGGMKTRMVDDWRDTAGFDGGRAFSVYLGAKSSDKRLHIYDKKREQKFPGAEWTRVEVRLKRRVAMAAAAALVENGAFEVAKDLAMRSVDFVGAWWSERLKCAGERVVSPVQRIEGNTARWVDRTAIPSTLDYLTEHYDEAVFFKAFYGLMALVNSRYKGAVRRDQDMWKSLRDAGF